MLYLVVGAGGAGKTTLIRDVLLPTLLARPEKLTPLAPPDGFKIALVDDPIRPLTGGQYPGARYADVAAFRRARARKLVACFDGASSAALMRLALECRGAILVLDEIDRALPAGPQLQGDAKRIVDEGRHYGVCVIGTARRLHAVNKDARVNCQGAWIGNLTDGDSQRAAAQMISASRELLERTRNFSNLSRGEFVFWNRETGEIKLTRVKNSRIVEFS